jgi:hypothetical protein
MVSHLGSGDDDLSRPSKKNVYSNRDFSRLTLPGIYLGNESRPKCAGRKPFHCSLDCFRSRKNQERPVPKSKQFVVWDGSWIAY